MKNLTLLLVVLISFSTHGLEVTEALLRQSFTGQDTSEIIPQEKLQLLIDLAEFADRRQLIDDVKEKLGVSEDLELGKLVFACTPEKGSVMGNYQGGSVNRSFIMKMADGAAPDWRMTPEELQAFFFSTSLENDFENILIMQEGPRICLRPGQDIKDTFGTFIHELIHFARVEKRWELDFYEIAYTLDEADYIREALHRPGGEFNAFVEGTKAEMALQNKIKMLPSKSSMFQFTMDGELIDPAKYAEYILKELGYEETFKENYHNALYQYYSNKIGEYNRHLRYQDSASRSEENSKTNLQIVIRGQQIYASNIEIYQSNIKNYKRFFQKEKIKEAENNIAVTEQKLQKAKLDAEKYKKSIQFWNQQAIKITQKLSELKLVIDDLELKLPLKKDDSEETPTTVLTDEE